MKKKWYGEERRLKMVSLLKENEEAIKGGALADLLGVSRQVIVQDVTLLKAHNYPITATSQGYLWTEEDLKTSSFTKVVACIHTPERTEEELNMLVDNGIRVKDVLVEHPVYGDLRASIGVKNRKQVQQFLTRVKETQASYLSELTGGVHLHTLEADSKEDIDDGVKALKEAGFLVEDKQDMK
ncbi:transcription repressor NadR [Alkalicoccus daliensis]|uniref:Transcription repressor NadR n=1 Tax=Alkalicoccus daliensis TaxID=745820 RepID=A0A1H0DQ84_9BACI|nr:transcription repressor NadR [Alkalicoccus daliensis]SDN72302.1 hypothetical protein SAMN04488053_10343 [Alkalicoccus daliensis]